MRGWRASIVAAVLFVAASIASPLGAAEPSNDGAFGIVVFAVDPQSREAQAMVDAVRAHLTGLPVRLVIETGSGSAANGAEAIDGARRIGTLTIDPATPVEWVVSFTEPAIDTTLVRRIRVKPQAKRVALEEAAIVVRSMVEAILDGGHVGIARARAEEAAAASGSHAPWRTRHGIAATAAYFGTTFAPGLGWQSGGLLGLRWQSGGFYAGAGVEIFAPITTETTGVSLLLIRRPGVLFTGYEWPSRVAPTIEFEVMADYVTRSNASTDDRYVPQPAASRWFLGLGATAGLSWSFLPRFRLLAQGGADWILNPYSYVIVPDGVLVRPVSVRPKIAIGLGIDVW